MEEQLVEGLVVRVTGHEIWVDAAGQRISTVLRGRFRTKSGRRGGPKVQVVAGDRVMVQLSASEGAPGTIEEVLERRCWLSRYAGRHNSERAIVANIDVLFLVVSVASPEILPGFVDRVLVSAERGRTPVRICVNKIDLLTAELEDEVASFEAVYSRAGYAMYRMSAETGDGVDEIKAFMQGGVYAFAGQSGAGKSSLLNVIDPELDLRVREVAPKSGRGRHTTTYSQLYPIGGGYVADTPGMQTFGFPGTEKTELAECFPEFREYIADCRFQPCTHSHEPDCAVKAALEEGVIDAGRYKSYIDMLAEVEERVKGRF